MPLLDATNLIVHHANGEALFIVSEHCQLRLTDKHWQSVDWLQLCRLLLLLHRNRENVSTGKVEKNKTLDNRSTDRPTTGNDDYYYYTTCWMLLRALASLEPSYSSSTTTLRGTIHSMNWLQWIMLLCWWKYSVMKASHQYNPMQAVGYRLGFILIQK